MKAILMSIRPRHVRNILNLIKLWEIRKRFPKDYVGWVYIYCTKNHKEVVFGKKQNVYLCDMRGKTESGFDFMTLIDNEDNEQYIKKTLNGKVVARFWCDKVVEYINGGRWNDDNTFGSYDDYIKDNVCEEACITEEELFAYCEDLAFSSIHISKLEIFDKPMELSEFKRVKWKNCNVKDKNGLYQCHRCPYFIKYAYGFGNCGYEEPLTKAPQSYIYIEEGSQNEH